MCGNENINLSKDPFQAAECVGYQGGMWTVGFGTSLTIEYLKAKLGGNLNKLPEKQITLDNSESISKVKPSEIGDSYSAWDEGPVSRGKLIDQLRGNNLGDNFPVMDRLDPNGKIVSVKSLDTGAESYSGNTPALKNILNTYIDDVNAFNEVTWNEQYISPKVYPAGKQIELVIPDKPLIPLQIEIINDAIVRANTLNIDFKVIVLK